MGVELSGGGELRGDDLGSQRAIEPAKTVGADLGELGAGGGKRECRGRHEREARGERGGSSGESKAASGCVVRHGPFTVTDAAACVKVSAG